MRGLIRSFAGDGMTVLVSSHLISEIEQICDYVVMIRAGHLVHQGSVADLRATQQPVIVVASEHDADVARLAEVLQWGQAGRLREAGPPLRDGPIQPGRRGQLHAASNRDRSGAAGERGRKAGRHGNGQREQSTAGRVAP
jgi:ABC-type multidrug transport system ATPase subunit